ncbi:MAG: polysaccharide deacetylase family protein [Bacteroidales bacterium]|jgi:peptidoglycan-N-acetylglucosamine deacetylase|nr:polysaccharide deacetylase family protein [Bacteroidales bacterium]
MIIEQPPYLFRALYPKAIWRMSPKEKAVYLTFDDGPIPEVTPWVLDLLDKYQIKACFFMVGDNVKKHPDVFRMVKERGHLVGNHTFNHIRGYEIQGIRYLKNIEDTTELIHSPYFRPPHGQLRRNQSLVLHRKYKVIMWDLVTRDYSNKLNGEQVFKKVKKYARNGSIIVFHDSLKAEKNMKYALPLSIEWLLSQGYTFKTFDQAKE